MTDLEADAIITLWRDDKPVLSVMLEVQLGRMRDKVWAWRAYLGIQRLRRRCPVLLVVICVTAAMAARGRRPIDIGHPGLVLKPIVIGPPDIPRVTDIDQARAMPALAVLSALAYSTDRAVLSVLPEALSPLNPGVFAGYYRLIEAGLSASGRSFLEERMRTPYKSEFANKHHSEGYDEGLARAVVKLLEVRGVWLDPDARRRIQECHDESQFLDWLGKAASATSAEELFA